MNENKKIPSRKRLGRKAPPSLMSDHDLAALGGGRVAYIKVMSSDEARRMYPTVDGVPTGINLYALQAADGTPIALTDTLQVRSDTPWATSSSSRAFTDGLMAALACMTRNTSGGRAQSPASFRWRATRDRVPGQAPRGNEKAPNPGGRGWALQRHGRQAPGGKPVPQTMPSARRGALPIQGTSSAWV